MEGILKYRRIKSTVAIKSIDAAYGQRTEEKLQRLLYLSHENLVKLVMKMMSVFMLSMSMIGDFGLSTYEYSDTHKLTKEYDVYSFGLVLFEVLSGALTHFKISKDDPKFLPDIVKRGFNQKELDTIIGPMLRQEFEKYRSLIGNRSAESLNMFANIAYRCFQEKAKGRPTMADIVEELEKAYKYHVSL
uniref:Phloem protein 2-like protein n=1 Tax=Tanacetum cinerariifolium TaxID=118510 RepID=A0A699HJJ4_TANCI|nr:phloem protein 2-like protein [Tanacetum cinerariifolium]